MKGYKGVPDTKLDTVGKFIGGFVVGYLGTKTVKTLVQNRQNLNQQRGPEPNGVQYHVPEGQPNAQSQGRPQQQISQSSTPSQASAATINPNAQAAMQRLAKKNPNVAKFLEDNGDSPHLGQAQIPGPYDK